MEKIPGNETAQPRNSVAQRLSVQVKKPEKGSRSHTEDNDLGPGFFNFSSLPTVTDDRCPLGFDSLEPSATVPTDTARPTCPQRFNSSLSSLSGSSYDVRAAAMIQSRHRASSDGWQFGDGPTVIPVGEPRETDHGDPVEPTVVPMAAERRDTTRRRRTWP